MNADFLIPYYKQTIKPAKNKVKFLFKAYKAVQDVLSC